jgi:glycine/D-amino acid oxidase-like deaminating enzyme
LDEKRLAGVYMLSALGSRGLTTALLCAQWLADQIEGRPLAASEALSKAMQCDLENA